MSADDMLTTEDVRSDYQWGATACGCCATYNEADGQAFDRWLAAHDAEVESRVRAQIAADIGNLEHAREEVRERQAAGYSVTWAEGYDEAVVDAARIAAGGAS